MRTDREVGRASSCIRKCVRVSSTTLTCFAVGMSLARKYLSPQSRYASMLSVLMLSVLMENNISHVNNYDTL